MGEPHFEIQVAKDITNLSDRVDKIDAAIKILDKNAAIFDFINPAELISFKTTQERILDHHKEFKDEIGLIKNLLKEHRDYHQEQLIKLERNFADKDKEVNVKIAKFTGAGAGVGALIGYALSLLKVLK